MKKKELTLCKNILQKLDAMERLLIYKAMKGMSKETKEYLLKHIFAMMDPQ